MKKTMKPTDAPKTHTDGYGIKRTLTPNQRSQYASGYNGYRGIGRGHHGNSAMHTLGWMHAQNEDASK